MERRLEIRLKEADYGENAHLVLLDDCLCSKLSRPGEGIEKVFDLIF